MKDSDKLYRRLKERMMLVASLPPQELGVLTPYWRRVVSFIKVASLPLLVVTGFVSSFILWLLLGPTLVHLTTILQNGF